MAHVVMCWELGGDLGHVARMRPLAESLRARGHRVSFVVRETLAAGRLLDPAHYAWLQAPLQPDLVSPVYAPTLNFTQIMHNVGFHEHKALVGRMRAWRNLYDALKPDLLVFDHSPTALLAARGQRVKRILLGTGFGIPPATEPLPPFDTETGASGLETSELEILERINAALKTFGVERLKRIADIYQADASLLFTLKELDHYPQRQNGDYWGPPAQGGGSRPDWPEGAGKRVFAYLKPFKTLPALLETLGQAGHRTLIYMSRQDGHPQATSGRLHYADKPVDLVQAVTGERSRHLPLGPRHHKCHAARRQTSVALASQHRAAHAGGPGSRHGRGSRGPGIGTGRHAGEVPATPGRTGPHRRCPRFRGTLRRPRGRKEPRTLRCPGGEIVRLLIQTEAP